MGTTTEAATTAMANTCSIEGMHWTRETQINPVMVVSKNGRCGTRVHSSSASPMLMEVSVKPMHGQVKTFHVGTTEPGFRYIPDPGYVGADTFVMLTGKAIHEIYANFTVTVTP